MSKSEQRTAKQVTDFILRVLDEYGPLKGTQLAKRMIREFDCTWAEAELWINARLMIGTIYSNRDDKIMPANPINAVLAECIDIVAPPEESHATEVGSDEQPGGDLPL